MSRSRLPSMPDKSASSLNASGMPIFFNVSASSNSDMKANRGIVSATLVYCKLPTIASNLEESSEPSNAANSPVSGRRMTIAVSPPE